MGLIRIVLSLGKRLTLKHILLHDCVPFVKHKTGISVNVLLQQRHEHGLLKIGKVSEILRYHEKFSDVTIGPLK